MDSSADLPALIHQTLSLRMDEAREGRLRLRIPPAGGDNRMTPNSHYHLTPELFLQVSGVTRMDVPGKRVSFYPGEICLVPRMTPHAEKSERYRGDFLNLVVCVPSAGNIYIHKSVAGARGFPIVMQRIHYLSPHEEMLRLAMDQIARVHAGHSALRPILLQGLEVTLFALLAEITSGQRNASPISSENRHVADCKRFIQGNLANPRLNVRMLAEMIGVTPDYLSNLFAIQTGERLTAYLNRQRIANARALLAGSKLNISEVAWASGYADPAYFTRVFSRITGVSPARYRGNPS